MRRFVIALPFVLALILLVAPHAHAAGVPILNSNFHIVPEAHDFDSSCPVGAPLSYGGVLQLIQNLVNAAVALGFIAFTLVLAYTGVSFMLNPTNPEKRSQAREMLLNIIIGMVILLGAWLFVDFIMKSIYNDSSPYGPWNSILAPGKDSWCIKESQTKPFTGVAGGIVNAITGNQPPNATNAGTPVALSNSGKDACNATKIASAAAAGGIRMPTQEAKTLACLAGPESGCGNILKNYGWDSPDPKVRSTAYGPFQILLKTNARCFANSTCSAAAGVSSSLDCSQAFDSHGFSIPGTLLSQCQRAAANLSCSAVAADCVYNSPGGSSAWTADSHNAKQKACIAANGG